MARAVGATHPANLPDDPQERKKYPLASGVFRYFPDALVEVARVSWEGNNQHNPGEPLHWARGKSNDQEDTLLRHLAAAGTKDIDGQRHSAKMAWRALAILQLEIEAEQDGQKSRRPMDTICLNCGKSYGQHFGEKCPDRKSTFTEGK